MDKIIGAVKHYQKNLEKYETLSDVNGMLHCLTQLSKLSVKITHLEATGVGRTVSALRKTSDPIGPAAKALITQWKRMVIREQEYTDEPEHSAFTPESSSSKDKKHKAVKDKNKDVDTNKKKNHKHSSKHNDNSSSHKRKHHHNHKTTGGKRQKSDASEVKKTSRHFINARKSTKHTSEIDTVPCDGEGEIEEDGGGITAQSGASFAEALAGLPETSQQCRTDNTTPNNSRMEKKSKAPLGSSDGEIDGSDSGNDLMVNYLPQITPNYRPLSNLYDPLAATASAAQKPTKSVHINLTARVKTQRTRVFSGIKSSTLEHSKIPTLFTSCMRVLQNNIDLLEYTGGIPYDILKPILEKATVQQLFNLENFNAYLVGSTEELWQLHCEREFKEKSPQELESWRDLYLRCKDERAAKLKALTANIRQQQDSMLPMRTTKLAYVDHEATRPVRTPGRPKKAQQKNGGGDSGVGAWTAKQIAMAHNEEHDLEAVPNIVRERAARKSNGKTGGKPKVAPLMAKSLMLMKTCFRK